MKRFQALILLPVLIVGYLAGPAIVASSGGETDRPNILFITVDDMSCDSVGVFGCKLAGTTPHIDRLAAEGLRFKYAHVQVANCMPSRNVMLSGRYPHNNRVEGFYQIKDPDYPVLADLMKQRGYFTAIRGKVSHSTPYHPYDWDLVLDGTGPQRAHPKNVESYYTSTKQGIAAGKEAAKPFCLVINISDPHKPFYALGRRGEVVDDPNKPTRVFTADEVPVPGFLPDEPVVRKELAHYYSSVRRADDCVGAVLRALGESGQEKNTVVMFLSDHGMPFPFAKTAVYHHSTHTPWIVRWPAVTKAGSVDERHMISAVDLTPTLLDIAEIEHPAGIDGRSFLPLLKGDTQSGRDMIIKEYNENAGGGRHPMRSVQTRRFGYIFNPWADGRRVFKTATTGTMTYRKMRELAETDKYHAARLELFDHRVREELYDYENDPDALHNLIDDPAYREEAGRLREALEAWMVRTGDHLLEAFRHRDDDQVVEAYMKRVEAESAERRKQKAKSRRPATRKKKLATKLISLQTPEAVTPGQPVTIKVGHTIPDDLGEQLVHVTLKGGDGRKRIDRKVLKAKGTGTLEVSFDVPAEVPGGSVHFAVFIGKDHPNNLQYIHSDPVPAR